MRGNATPGWYPDPSGGGQWRYWDGQRWGQAAPTAGFQPPIADPAADAARSRKRTIWTAAVVAGFLVVGATSYLIDAYNRDESRTAGKGTETSTSTPSLPPPSSATNLPPATSIPEWAGRTAPVIGVLGDAMRAVSVAAIDRSRRPLDYWANLNARCRNLLDAAAAVRAQLPAPDPGINERMGIMLDDVGGAASACSTFGPGTPAAPIEAAASQLDKLPTR